MDFIQEKENLNIEMRSWLEKANAKEVPVEEAKTKIEELRAKKIDLEKQEALMNAPKEERSTKMDMNWQEIKNALIEKRAITIGAGNGATNVVPEIVSALSHKYGITKNYGYFYGPNASTVIPVLSPTIARPAGQNEGVTNVANDNTAALAMKTLLPKAYVSVLPVSAEALTLGGFNLEGKLPSLFADAFARSLFEGSLVGGGTGNDMTGMFLSTALSNSVNCGAAGAPKILDLVKLALTVQDFADDAFIVIHPNFMAGMLAENTAETGALKAQLLTGSIMGVKVVCSSRAPTTTTATSVVAVAMPMSNYGVAMASQITIDPIKVKGDTNTYFQATAFFNGSPIVAANGWKLVTV